MSIEDKQKNILLYHTKMCLTYTFKYDYNMIII